MSFYYCGFNTTSLFSVDGDVSVVVDSFSKVQFPGITNFQIGWSYFLIWKEKELYIIRKVEEDSKSIDSDSKLLEIPEDSLDSCKQAAPGKDSIVILTENNKIWLYKIYENSWKRVANFISTSNDSEDEYPVKLLQGGCTVVLTNLGRVFNVPTLVEMPKRVKFTDIACGLDHTIMLAENGDVYSMGMGTRGQLGHNDLEDSDNPRLVEALAGIKVVNISARGWHSAVVTDQGDLYTWGWNTDGQLGLSNQDSKVVAVPTVVDFKNDQNESVDVSVKKVECGNTFTVCMFDDGSLWGCGSNKYGQLGQPRESFASSLNFLQLRVPLNSESVKDLKCREWGTILVAE